MNSFVLDASVACSWCFPNDQSEDTALSRYTLSLLNTHDALVPGIWLYEVANILKVAIKRRRITSQNAEEFAQRLQALPIEVDPDQGWRNLHLYSHAFECDLSAYDAAYLDLALRTGLPLATADRLLSKAAQLMSLPVVAVPAGYEGI